MQKTKTVNILVQVMATIFIPTGIYAYWRIGKVRIGIISYLISFGIGIISGLLIAFSSDSYHYLISIGGLIISIILPMIIIIFLSNEYNLKLKT